MLVHRTFIFADARAQVVEGKREDSHGEIPNARFDHRAAECLTSGINSLVTALKRIWLLRSLCGSIL